MTDAPMRAPRRVAPRKTHPRRQRVVVVGGGIAGLTAAYELSRTPALRDRYEVTVYQLGFRLGGKLASGRNPAKAYRNEEHGLHVWFGFYENTFRLAREVYQAWRAPEDCPFRSVWDVVKPQRHALLGHRWGDGYQMAPVHFPRSCDAPGERMALPSALGLVAGVLDAARALTAVLARESGRTPRRPLTRFLWAEDRPTSFLWAAPGQGDRDLIASYEDRLARLTRLIAARWQKTTPARRRKLAESAHQRLVEAHPRIARSLDRLTRGSPGYRPLYHFVDTSLAFFRGLIHPDDGIYVDGDLDRVNDRDFRQWLRDNGCSEDTAANSPWIEALYDSSFQYLGGRREEPSFEAGTAARYVIRGYLAYKHCPAYLIEAGMGEAFVAPLYEVLRDRGVRFAFFHRLEDMTLSPDGRELERLHFVEQAQPKAGHYDPLFTYRGLRCWPSQPDFDQLENGELLRATGVDFESRWSPPADDRPKTLERGRDFDAVVMALPLGAIAPDADGKTPCRAWIDAVPAIRLAAEGINLMPSVAAQLWFDRDMESLGWSARTSVVGWATPLSIWCDMTPVLAHEGWPSTSGPRACVYLCGVGAPGAPGVGSGDPEGHRRARREAMAAVAAQLKDHGATMWPGAALSDGSFDWSVLHDPEGRRGRERLHAQYVRLNAEPWDLTAGAAVGNGSLRPEAHESGLDNVALAGTWTKTSVGTSAIEAAIMSGMAAARALGAEEREIIGEGFLCRRPSGERIGILRDHEDDEAQVA